MTSVAPETTTDVTAAALGAEPEIEGRTPRQLFWARFRQDKAALVGLGLIVLLLLIAILAGLIAKLVGHGPNDLYQNQTLDQFGLPTGPSSSFLFGVDQSGRDVFVRVLYGTRTSLEVALGATGIAVFIGVVLGMAAGYLGGAVDTLISRVRLRR